MTMHGKFVPVICLCVLFGLIFACSMNNSNGSNTSSVNTSSESSSVASKGTNWGLYWSDEFNGSSVDRTIWSNQIFPAGHFNNEWEAYTASPNNFYITNISGESYLTIKAIWDSNSIASGHYTSARIITGFNKYFKFGKISARMKLPYGQGIWPAFWMLGTNINELPGGTVAWPTCGEVDIMEMVGGGAGRDNKIYGTIHGPGYSGGNGIGGNITLSSGNFSDAFHVFEVVWSNNYIHWFLDGTNYKSVNSSQVPGTWVYNQPFYIIFNLAVGGDWPGSPNSSTQFPQYMYVDWLRVYTNY